MYEADTETDIAHLVNIQSFQLLETVCIDFLLLEQSKGGHHNTLVITDHFANFALAYPTKNQTAKSTADALYNR